MSTDVVEAKRIELRNFHLIQAKRKLRECLNDVEYLILATSSGERRNALTDANILLMQGYAAFNEIKMEPLT
jgi:hypothetical protein